MEQQMRQKIEAIIQSERQRRVAEMAVLAKSPRELQRSIKCGVNGRHFAIEVEVMMLSVIRHGLGIPREDITIADLVFQANMVGADMVIDRCFLYRERLTVATPCSYLDSFAALLPLEVFVAGVKQ